MKSRITAAVGVAVLAIAVVGCTPPASQSGDAGVPQNEGTPDKLTMLVTASPSATGLRELADEYTMETGIAIEFVEVPSAQLPTKIILAKQSGQATFDLAQVDGFTLPQVVAAGALLPLDDYLAEDEEYDYADFPKGLQDYAKQDGVSYGLPLSTEPYLQWYRTDLYEQAGIEPATTWDQALENAAALQDAGHYGFAEVYGPAVAANYFDQMLYSSGGRLLDPETNRPLLDSDVAKEVMERFLALEEYSPASSATAASADVVNAFSQLDVGALILASGWYGTINDPSKSGAADKFSTAGVPLSEDGEYEPVNILNGWLAGISSVSPNQKAAWDFLSWALGAQNVQTFIDVGAPPAGRTSTTSDQDYIEQLPYLPAVGEATQDGVPAPRIPEMGQIVVSLSQTISAMASDQLTLDEGMEKAQNDLLNILVQSGRYQG